MKMWTQSPISSFVFLFFLNSAQTLNVLSSWFQPQNPMNGGAAYGNSVMPGPSVVPPIQSKQSPSWMSEASNIFSRTMGKIRGFQPFPYRKFNFGIANPIKNGINYAGSAVNAVPKRRSDGMYFPAQYIPPQYSGQRMINSYNNALKPVYQKQWNPWQKNAFQNRGRLNQQHFYPTEENTPVYEHKHYNNNDKNYDITNNNDNNQHEINIETKDEDYPTSTSFADSINNYFDTDRPSVNVGSKLQVDDKFDFSTFNDDNDAPQYYGYERRYNRYGNRPNQHRQSMTYGKQAREPWNRPSYHNTEVSNEEDVNIENEFDHFPSMPSSKPKYSTHFSEMFNNNWEDDNQRQKRHYVDHEENAEIWRNRGRYGIEEQEEEAEEEKEEKSNTYHEKYPHDVTHDEDKDDDGYVDFGTNFGRNNFRKINPSYNHFLGPFQG